MKPEAPAIDLSHKEFLTLDKDYAQTAAAVDLVYVKDTTAGIVRRGSGKKFSYFYNDKPVKDPETLDRIKKLVIPPAWTNVWICHDPSGHIQATGIDIRTRKQ